MRSKRSSRIGYWLFVLPVVLVIVVIVFAVVSLTTNQTGNLEIVAQTTDRLGQTRPLAAPALVSGHSGITPFQVALSSGTYTVLFQPLEWYSTPPARTITLPGGQTVYAVGVYDPIVRVIGIGRDGFNVSQVTALHGVTPVIWKNLNGTSAVLLGDGFGRAIIAAGQNFTYIYTAPGSFSFQLMSSPEAGTVTVS